MSDEERSALDSDNPESDDDAGSKGLGSDTGAEGGPGDEGQDVTELMPENRGEVRYPDKEEFSEERPTTAPVEGGIDEEPETVDTASDHAED